MIKNYDMVEIYILQLLDEDERWWTIEEIAIQLHLAKATVQKYISLLKVRLQSYPKSDIYLEGTASKGIRLHRHPAFNTQVLYSDILTKQLAFSLIDSTLKYGTVPIVKIALDNFTSVASVRRKYFALNTTLKRANLAIKNNTIRGREEDIRWFYSEYYWEIFKGIEWPFSNISQPRIYKLIGRIEQALRISMVPEVKEKLSYWIAINHIRYSKGYRISGDIEIKKYTTQKKKQLSLFIERLSEYNSDKNQIYSFQQLEEVELLFFVLNSLSAAEENKTFMNSVLQAHREGNTLMYQMTQDWMLLYGNYFYETDFYYTPIQNKLLHIHSLSYLFTIDESLLLKTNYSKELIQTYPTFFTRMEKIYATLSKHYPSITKNKHYLMERYTLIAIEHLTLDIFEPAIKIAVSFSEGHLYELVGQKKIAEHFSGAYKIKFVRYFETRDILITDLPQLASDSLSLIVNVELQLRKRDFYNIEKVIVQHLKTLIMK